MTQEDVGAREIHPRPRGGLRAQGQKECANNMVVMATRGRNCAREAGPRTRDLVRGGAFVQGAGPGPRLGEGETGGWPLLGNARAPSSLG